RHTRSKRDWSADVCSSDLAPEPAQGTSRRTGEFGATGPRRSERDNTREPERSTPSRTERRTAQDQNPVRKFLVYGLAIALFVAETGRASCSERVSTHASQA